MDRFYLTWLTYDRFFLFFFQWQVEAQEYCPNAKLVLVGCKLDMRTDVSTLRELSKQRLIPVTHEQVSVHTLTHTHRGLEHEEKREIVLGLGVCDIEKKLYLDIFLDFFDNDN